MKKPINYLLFAIACCFALGSASTAFADDKAAAIDPTQFDWSTTPEALRAKVDTGLKTEHFGKYKRYWRSVRAGGDSWHQFFVFYGGTLVAQGYERAENLPKTRVGTISDVVSYDNNHAVVKALTHKHGEPAFVDQRTRKEFSQELGDDALRVKRSLEWDMLGERFRWELDDGTIRYTVQYSMDGLAEHRVVNVNPSKWSHYFDFQTIDAFRDAGIRRVRGFHSRTNKWVVASFSPSGKFEVQNYNPPGSAKPRSPKRTQWTTSNCRLAGKSCDITYKFFGGHLYEVEIDLSQSGKFPRRGHHEELGKAFYKHFMAADGRLERYLGSPSDAKHVQDLDNGREMLKVKNLVQGQEGFWSAWYDVGNDILVRHTISGDSDGAGYRIDHKISFRFHNVSRALTEKDAWKAETATARAAKGD